MTTENITPQPCPVEAIGRTLEHPTIAAMVAENDENLAAESQAWDAVAVIKYAARDEIAANPVIVTLTRMKPDGEAVTREVQFIDGEPTGEHEDLLMSICILNAAGKPGRGDTMTALEAEMIMRFDEARRVSKERADAIRERVYRERGMEAAQEAEAKAQAAASASGARLWNARINTMADAIAALEFIRDINAEWDGLGDRALAFLKKGGVQ